MKKYPLLCKGIRLPSVAAGAVSNENGTFVSGRGRCVQVDIVNGFAPLEEAYHTLTIGGQNVVQDVPAGFFAWFNFPGQYPRIVGNYGQNQSWQLLTANGSVAPFQPNFIEYYENPVDNAQFRRNMNAMVLSTKRVHYTFLATAGTSRTEQFVAPKSRGKIFAIQPFIDRNSIANPSAVDPVTMSVDVNGISIIETVTALHFVGDSTRQNIFPIDIEPGSTFTITINNLAGGSNIFGGMALFFVPDDQC